MGGEEATAAGAGGQSLPGEPGGKGFWDDWSVRIFFSIGISDNLSLLLQLIAIVVSGSIRLMKSLAQLLIACIVVLNI